MLQARAIKSLETRVVPDQDGRAKHASRVYFSLASIPDPLYSEENHFKTLTGRTPKNGPLSSKCRKVHPCHQYRSL